MRKADRAKRLCGEIPGGDIKTLSGKTAIFRKGGNAFEDIRAECESKNHFVRNAALRGTGLASTEFGCTKFYLLANGIALASIAFGCTHRKHTC